MTEHRSYDELLAAARDDERELVIGLEREGDRAIVRMSDPTNLNALSAPLTLQLQDALAALVADREVGQGLRGRGQRRGGGRGHGVRARQRHRARLSERAQFVPAFMKIGLLPEVGTSWLLTRRIGYQRTFELFAGGEAVSGEEAAASGSPTPWFRTTSSWAQHAAGATASQRCPSTRC